MGRCISVWRCVGAAAASAPEGVISLILISAFRSLDAPCLSSCKMERPLGPRHTNYFHELRIILICIVFKHLKREPDKCEDRNVRYERSVDASHFVSHPHSCKSTTETLKRCIFKRNVRPRHLLSRLTIHRVKWRCSRTSSLNCMCELANVSSRTSGNKSNVFHYAIPFNFQQQQQR